MNGQSAISQARLTISSLRDEGFSLEDLAAIFGVTRPTITKYTHHPEMITLAEFAFIEKFYSDYMVRKQLVTDKIEKEDI